MTTEETWQKIQRFHKIVEQKLSCPDDFDVNEYKLQSKFVAQALKMDGDGDIGLLDVISTKFKVGDLVHYTNGNGVYWGIKEVIGITIWDSGDVRYFIAPNEAYWFPVCEDRLRSC